MTSIQINDGGDAISPADDSVCIAAAGAWPFVSRRVYKLAGEVESIWTSRQHRKSLGRRRAASSLATWVFNPQSLNWWIGCIFAIGSSLFAAGSLLTLVPQLAKASGLEANINAIFFAGSIPFTTAAWLQLFQAANAGRSPNQSRKLFGWRPHDVGWLSCALQFAGTILFNFNTFDGMIPGLNWFQSDLAVWTPNILGSLLFFASGYLAWIETCHAHWSFQPREIAWWIVAINLLGCISFLLSAFWGISLPTTPEDWPTISVAFTLAGAICFLIGALLMLPEAEQSTSEPTTADATTA